MAAGTNSVAMFFEDGTWRMVPWSEVSELSDGRRYVGLHVYHAQHPDPTRLPNLVRIGGYEIVAAKWIPGRNALMTRRIDTPSVGNLNQGVIREVMFFATPPYDQEFRDLAIPVEVAHSGMHVVNFTINDDALWQRSEQTNLAAQPVPSSGTY